MRAAQSDVVVSLGMVTMLGNLYTPEATESKKAARMKNCCKQCHEKDGTVSTLRNRSFCEEHDGIVDSDDVIKGKELDDGSITIVGTVEEVKDIKEPTLTQKQVDLVVHKADEADEALFAGEGSAYVFMPSTDNDFYHVILNLMDEDGRILCDDGEDRVLVGGLRVRDLDHVVRLTKWNGHLVFKCMLRPEQLKEFPSVSPKELTDKNLSMGRMLIAAQTEDFDADNYKDENRERLAQWIAARSNGVTITPTTKAKQPTQDLDDMLAAALAAAQAKAS